MEQGGDLADAAICADFFSDHPGHLRHFGRVLQHILAVAGAKLQLTEQAQHLLRNTHHSCLAHRIFAGLFDLFVDLLLCLGYHFFDPGWVNPAILHQHFQTQPRYLPANRIKATEHNHPWRIIDQYIDTGLSL